MKKEAKPENLSEVMAALGRRRMASMTKKQRRTFAASGGKTSWAGMSAQERIIEMRRRCRVRMKNKAKRALAKLAELW